MARYLLFVLSRPTEGEGHEDRFNRWYDETHVPEISAIEGVTHAQRYKLVAGNMPGLSDWQYASAYEIETDDLPAVFAGIGEGTSPFPPEFDTANARHLVALAL